MSLPDLDIISAAADRIRPHIIKTPVMTSENIDRMTGAEIFFRADAGAPADGRTGVPFPSWQGIRRFACGGVALLGGAEFGRNRFRLWRKQERNRRI